MTTLSIQYNTIQTWVLRSLQKKRTEAAELKLLRTLAGYTLQDHIRNEQARTELRISNILKKKDYRTKHHPHLKKMTERRRL